MNIGIGTSVTIGVDGLGLVSYLDSTDRGDLKVAHCSNVACTEATITSLDVDNLARMYSSITLGADGLGLIGYFARTSNDDGLKIAHCSNVTCSDATHATLDSGNTGHYVAATTGADGLGIFTYKRAAGGLKFAHCSNAGCTESTISTVESNRGEYSSVTIGADGLGLISYPSGYVPGVVEHDLMVAHCSNASCTEVTKTILDQEGRIEGETSVAIGADGLGLISYHMKEYGLKVAHCSNVQCTAATITTLDTGLEWLGTYSSLTIGSDGLGLISYRDGFNQHLKVAHCSNTSCTEATINSPDQSGSVAGHISVTIGYDGMPLIGYYDNGDYSDGRGDLKILHCGNYLCSD